MSDHLSNHNQDGCTTKSTCEQHCNSAHGCQCCGGNEDTYNGRYIIHVIKVNNVVYGTIFYDFSRNGVFFEDSQGDEYPMTQLVRNCFGGTGGKGGQFRPIYREEWCENTQYALNTTVYIGSRVYVALRPNKDMDPRCNPHDWALFFDVADLGDIKCGGTNHHNDGQDGDLPCELTACDVMALPTPRHYFFNDEPPQAEYVKWIPEIQFKVGDPALLDGELYTSLVAHRSSLGNRPGVAPGTWRLEEVVERQTQTVYLLLVNSSDAVETDSQTGCSRRMLTGRAGEYDFDARNPQEPVTYDIRKRTNNAVIELPVTRFQYIVNINRNIYDVRNEVKILRTGWYNVSFHLAYSGTVRLVRAVVFKCRGKVAHEVEASHAEGDVSNGMRTINHMFPVKIDEGSVLELRLSVVPAMLAAATQKNTHEINQKFRLYPHKSWFMVQAHS